MDNSTSEGHLHCPLTYGHDSSNSMNRTVEITLHNTIVALVSRSVRMAEKS